MPNDAPDFTRAGCTLQFFTAKATPGGTYLQSAFVSGTTGVTPVFPARGTYRLATWGVTIEHTAPIYTPLPGYATLRVHKVDLDSIRWPTEMVSGRVQGYVVDTSTQLMFKVTGSTPVILFVTYVAL
jgi:hypothetical protein